MRSKPQSANPANKIPETPKKPFLSLNDLSKAITYTPVWLEGNPYRKIEGTEEIDFASKGQFACLLGPVGAKACINYRIKYGEIIDITLNKIFYIFSLMGKASAQPTANETAEQKVQREAEAKQAVEDLNSNQLETIFGTIYQPAEEMMIQVVAYILSVHGMVSKQIGPNQFECTDITEDEIVNAIQKAAVFNSTGDELEDNLVFYEIIEGAGIWNRAAKEVKDSAGN